jgi:sugar phosphate isomerase/epimerase
MNKHWNEITNIGIVFPKLFPHANTGTGPIVENLLKILTDPFFTAVEISYIKDDDVRKKVADYLQKSCIDIIFNGGSAFRELKIDLSSTDIDEKNKSIEKGKLLIDQSYELGAKILHIVTGKDPGKENRAKALDIFVDSSKQLCKYAQEKAKNYELTISVETGDRYFDRKYLLGPTNDAIKVMREVKNDYSNFGLLFDQGHFPVMQEDPYKALWEGKDYLTHVHIGNSYIKDQTKPYFGDKHIPFNVPDSEIGIDELAKFINTLDDISFFKKPKPTRRPVISFEVGAYDGEPYELVLGNIKRVFQEAWFK